MDKKLESGELIRVGMFVKKNPDYQPERSKREDLIKEMGKFRPKSLKPEDGYFPPPWDIDDNLEKTIGWFEFQKAMKEDPQYYLGCGALNTKET